MRNSQPNSIQEAVRSSITAAGGLEVASNDLALSVSSLSRASATDEDRPGGLGVNHLHRLGRINPAAADPIANHFSRLAGGMFIPLPSGGPICSDVHRLTKEFSDVLQSHAEAHSERSADPTDYTPQEAKKAAQETIELMQAAASYLSALQERFDR